MVEPLVQSAFFPLILIPLLLLPLLLQLPGIKGWLGESIMRTGFSMSLPGDTYRVINNVTIPDGQGGTTQIDHVVVSIYGLFVVETKHYKGWIFGAEGDRQWTQRIHGNHSQKFQNPLRQNYKHTECLRELLGLTKEQVKSVVVFTGDCRIKTPNKLPENVGYPRDCTQYIKAHLSAILTPAEAYAIEVLSARSGLSPTGAARANIRLMSETPVGRPPLSWELPSERLLPHCQGRNARCAVQNAVPR